MKGNVPMCYRGQLWAGLIGNEARINAQVFEAFKNDDFTFERRSDASHNDEANTSIIGLTGTTTSRKGGRVVKSNSLMRKDIPRTFPHLNKLFEEVHSLSTSLIDILGAFQNFRPDMEYV